MEIKTKFSIGDTVWHFVMGAVLSSKVEHIMINEFGLFYKVTKTSDLIMEHELFGSPKEAEIVFVTKQIKHLKECLLSREKRLQILNDGEETNV